MKKPKNNYIKTSVWLTKSLRSQLRKIAKQGGSGSQLIRNLLTEYFN